jgi:hypothetical protein
VAGIGIETTPLCSTRTQVLTFAAQAYKRLRHIFIVDDAVPVLVPVPVHVPIVVVSAAFLPTKASILHTC